VCVSTRTDRIREQTYLQDEHVFDPTPARPRVSRTSLRGGLAGTEPCQHNEQSSSCLHNIDADESQLILTRETTRKIRTLRRFRRQNRQLVYQKPIFSARLSGEIPGQGTCSMWDHIPSSYQPRRL